MNKSPKLFNRFKKKIKHKIIHVFWTTRHKDFCLSEKLSLQWHNEVGTWHDLCLFSRISLASEVPKKCKMCFLLSILDLALEITLVYTPFLSYVPGINIGGFLQELAMSFHLSELAWELSIPGSQLMVSIWVGI